LIAPEVFLAEPEGRLQAYFIPAFSAAIHAGFSLAIRR
jgi:hypothetical protein